MTDTAPDFETALQTWLVKAQAVVTAGYLGSIDPPVLVLERGRRYCRVCRVDSISRSAFAFIDQDGSVLKPDGWKRPAKGVRGSIFTENLGVGAYGANYLK